MTDVSVMSSTRRHRGGRLTSPVARLAPAGEVTRPMARCRGIVTGSRRVSATNERGRSRMKTKVTRPPAPMNATSSSTPP